MSNVYTRELTRIKCAVRKHRKHMHDKSFSNRSSFMEIIKCSVVCMEWFFCISHLFGWLADWLAVFSGVFLCMYSSRGCFHCQSIRENLFSTTDTQQLSISDWKFFDAIMWWRSCSVSVSFTFAFYQSLSTYRLFGGKYWVYAYELHVYNYIVSLSQSFSSHTYTHEVYHCLLGRFRGFVSIST